MHSGAEAPLGGERRHVHHGTAAGCHKMRPDGARDVERAVQVDVDDTVPFLGGLGREPTPQTPTGIVEQDVNRAVGVSRPGYGRLDRVDVTHVAGDECGLAAFLSNGGFYLSAFLLAPRHEDDFCAFPRKKVGSRLTDTAVASCDDRNPVIHSICHLLSPYLVFSRLTRPCVGQLDLL